MLAPFRPVVWVVFGALVWGCAPDSPNEHAAPEFAFRDFRAALGQRNGDVLWRFLGPETQARLEADAQAFEAAGGGAVTPVDLLVPAWVPSAAEIDTIERVSMDDAAAVLRVTTVLGNTSDVTLLRSDTGWRIELDLDRADPTGGTDE